MGAKGLPIRDDVPAAELRRLARREKQRAALRQVVLDGPEVEATGLSAWTLAELCRAVEERWGVSYHPGHMSKLMRRLGLSRQKARPSHPKADAAAREAFAKGGSRPPSTTCGQGMPKGA